MVTVEQVAELVRERASWRGRGKRVTASTLIEKFGVTLEQARDIMAGVHGKGGLRLVLSKGRYWTNATLVLDGGAS